MQNRIETRKLEQYIFKLDRYDVVVEYVESASRPLSMDVTIHKNESSGVLVLESRRDLNSLITLLNEAAALDDEKRKENRKW